MFAWNGRALWRHRACSIESRTTPSSPTRFTNACGQLRSVTPSSGLISATCRTNRSRRRTCGSCAITLPTTQTHRWVRETLITPITQSRQNNDPESLPQLPRILTTITQNPHINYPESSAISCQRWTDPCALSGRVGEPTLGLPNTHTPSPPMSQLPDHFTRAEIYSQSHALYLISRRWLLWDQLTVDRSLIGWDCGIKLGVFSVIRRNRSHRLMIICFYFCSHRAKYLHPVYTESSPGST